MALIPSMLPKGHYHLQLDLAVLPPTEQRYHHHKKIPSTIIEKENDYVDFKDG